MNGNKFFKPTVLYKEYMILDMIEKNPNITQREMSQAIGIAVSMVNDYLDTYEKQKLIIRKKHSTKNVEYFITKKGSERRKVLNMGYLNASQQLYNSAKENVEKFLIQVENKGFNKIILYGAGEVCEILLNVKNNNLLNRLKVIAVIDDDKNKIGRQILDTKIISLDDCHKYDHDGILISSYTNKDQILGKLMNIKYELSKIILFFS